MCGIVGYAGQKPISSVLLVGLKRLEYRGYDSSGIATIESGENEIIINKSVGKVQGLEKLLRDKIVYGGVGIGHTRWATHGEPSLLNAHPHISANKKIAVVHNGIIENYLQLKKFLISENYVCISDTDTEIICHLLEYHLTQEKNFTQAFYKTLTKLEGKFALAVICEDVPNNFYFASDGTPLIIAYGKESQSEALIASDIPALIHIADQYYHLHHREWGYFSDNTFSLFDWSYSPIEIQFSPIQVQEDDITKGEYAHFMLKEIHEQPDVIRNILNHRVTQKDGKYIINFAEMRMENSDLEQIGRVVLQACGTSLHAALIGQRYLEQYAKIPADSDFSSEFRYRNPVLHGDTLVISISQSGETADTLASLHSAKSQFLYVLAFVNNVHSTMAREADGLIKLMAGHEIGVASTKAYIAELINLFLFSLYMGLAKKSISNETLEKNIDNLQKLPALVSKILAETHQIKTIALFLKDHSDVIFLGRSENYPTALEGALKLKELSYIHASGYAGGEFKHGPIALISEKIPVIVVAPRGEVRNKMLSNLLEVKARKGKVISICTEDDHEIQELSDYSITIPYIESSLSPILSVIPLQLLAYYTALYRDCNVDQPRNLAKSVTVE